MKQGVVLGKTISDVAELRSVDYFQSSEEFHPFLMGETTPNYDWKMHMFTFPNEKMGSPFVPERSVLKGFFAELCADARNAPGLLLEIRQPAHWIFGSWSPEMYKCFDVAQSTCK